MSSRRRPGSIVTTILLPIGPGFRRGDGLGWFFVHSWPKNLDKICFFSYTDAMKNEDRNTVIASEREAIQSSRLPRRASCLLAMTMRLKTMTVKQTEGMGVMRAGERRGDPLPPKTRTCRAEAQRRRNGLGNSNNASKSMACMVFKKSGKTNWIVRSFSFQLKGLWDKNRACFDRIFFMRSCNKTQQSVICLERQGLIY